MDRFCERRRTAGRHGYVHDNNENKGECSITYTAQVNQAGDYEILLLSPPHSNRASNVPVTISINGEIKNVSVNQRPEKTKGFASLGKFSLLKAASVRVTLSNRDTDGYVVADGLQLLPIR